MVMWKNWKRHSKAPYWYALIPDHPNATSKGYVLEHRIVMENHLNRLLTKEEVVHHINSNKKDNKITNLELFKKRSHQKFHGNQTKNKCRIKLICAWCKKEFTRKGNDVRYAKKLGQKTFCCSYQCNGKLNN